MSSKANSFQDLPILPPDVQSKLESGVVVWLVLSGKMCSGKDIVAECLQVPGGKKILSYGNILRQDLKSVFDGFAHVGDRKDQNLFIQTLLGYTSENANALLDAIAALPKETNNNPWYRSHEMRTVLQKMGSEWLPDSHYLPKKAAVEAIDTLSQGVSVVIAGSRLLPDVDLPRSLGATLFRLEVTLETQLRRLKKRDNLEPSPELEEAMQHDGETTLDSYSFDARIYNNFEETPEGLTALMTDVQNELSSELDLKEILFD